MAGREVMLKLKVSERRSSTISAVAKRPDHHCGDDLVIHFISFDSNQILQLKTLFTQRMRFACPNRCLRLQLLTAVRRIVGLNWPLNSLELQGTAGNSSACWECRLVLLYGFNQYN